MPTVNVHQAKTRLSCLLAQAEAGEEALIARRGKPVVRLVPCKGKRRFGAMKGKIVVDNSILEPLPEEELALWEGRALSDAPPTRYAHLTCRSTTTA